MTKHKLRQFAEIETFENVFHHMQYSEKVADLPLKGCWNKSYFNNTNPIILELGCGKGEYTLGLAKSHPIKNFIGIDLKGNRIWRGEKTALENQQKNVAFLRTRIENIETCFEKDEVSEIWITFPDPQPQKARIKKRLTSPPFLERYKKFLKPNGIIHLKTDNAPLYEYTLEVIKENNYTLLESTNDLYEKLHVQDNDILANFPSETFSIQTFYEKKFSDKGFKICYLRFRI
jgi:tRNA (guanine-N7-)-methyltransferase